MKQLCFFLSFFCCLAIAEDITRARKEVELFEKEKQIINLDSVRDILKKDELSPLIEQKKEKITALKKQIKKNQEEVYSFPPRLSFFQTLLKFWIVKHESLLKWNFEFPEYGLEENLKSMFSKLGIDAKPFQILLLNSTLIPHLGIEGEDRHILLLSLPFIRTLDLSHEEISLILLEDYLRIEQARLSHYLLNNDLLDAHLEKSFLGDLGVVDQVVSTFLGGWEEFIFKKGFSFQDQYELTKSMNQRLSSQKELWVKYFAVLGKIDSLVKVNPLYKSYMRLFPSPEMQTRWLRSLNKEGM